MEFSKMHAGGSGGEISHSCSAALRGDKMLTTVECLRGMLQAERVASRAAREEQNLMAKRLTEMERLLDIEIKAWNRAEKWLRNALKKLQTLKNLDVSDSYPSLLSSTSTGLQMPGNRNSSNKSATYYSAHSVEGGADSINNGIHYCDDDDCTRWVSEQDQSINESKFIENDAVEDLVPTIKLENNSSKHAHSYKFQSRNTEEENSDNNQTPKMNFLASIKQVKDQPHDSMGRRVAV